MHFWSISTNVWPFLLCQGFRYLKFLYFLKILVQRFSNHWRPFSGKNERNKSQMESWDPLHTKRKNEKKAMKSFTFVNLQPLGTILKKTCIFGASQRMFGLFCFVRALINWKTFPPWNVHFVIYMPGKPGHFGKWEVVRTLPVTFSSCDDGMTLEYNLFVVYAPTKMGPNFIWSCISINISILYP